MRTHVATAAEHPATSAVVLTLALLALIVSLMVIAAAQSANVIHGDVLARVPQVPFG